MKQYLLKAIGVRGLSNLTENKEYITLRGIEPGIFEDRPFVSVLDDNGIGYSCHASRFEIVKELKEKDLNGERKETDGNSSSS